MNYLLIDACGWVACRTAGINIDNEVLRLLGKPEWIILDVVIDELQHLLSTKEVSPSTMLLDMLIEKSTSVQTAHRESTHTDDLILEIAKEKKATILTIDVDLKRRAYGSNIPIVEIRKGNRLFLVDSV